MTERIGVWRVGGEGSTKLAYPLEELQTTETEQKLEELLVASPEVLVPGLKLIGRQVVTEGGPLDLLGIDQSGTLVIFELKRGTLTRDAVAQILDYASDLGARDAEDFATLVEENSGRHGIEPIKDFADWYKGEFPDVSEPPPADLRLVLVGLGVDDRAVRIVNYLAQGGVDIQLLTFQAFRHGSETLLARRLETVEPAVGRATPSGGTKQGNERLLQQLAEEQGARKLFDEVNRFVQDLVPGYRWPGKTAATFSLQETTAHGTPSLRAYASVSVDPKVKGQVILSLPDRAIEAAPGAIDAITATVSQAQRTSNSWMPFQLAITQETWAELKQPAGNLLQAVVQAWQERATGSNEGKSGETA